MSVENERLVYLDGLRGWASFAVLLYHSYVNSYPATDFARNELWKLPLFNGTLAVMLFFVISGFSLALPFMATANRRTIVKLAAGRYVRLAIPILAACALVHIMLETGIIRAPADRVPFDRFMAFDPTVPHLLAFSLWDTFFNFSFNTAYIAPLWTMGVELIGSFVVLAIQFVTGRSAWRWIAYIVALQYFYGTGSYNALFVVGMALAEFRWLRETRSRWAGPILMVLALAMPLALDSGFWNVALTAILLFAGAIMTPWLRDGLSNRFSAFLGWISFPLYLLHSPVMYVIGVPLVIAAQGNPVMIMLAATVVLPFAVLAAIAFVPINELAIRVARGFGDRVATLAYAAFGLMTRLVAPRQPKSIR